MNFQVRLTLRSGPDLPFPTRVTVGIASVPSERISVPLMFRKRWKVVNDSAGYVFLFGVNFSPWPHISVWWELFFLIFIYCGCVGSELWHVGSSCVMGDLSLWHTDSLFAVQGLRSCST